MSKLKPDKGGVGRRRLRQRREERSVAAGIPPVSGKKVDAKLYAGVNLDEPAFARLDEDSDL